MISGADLRLDANAIVHAAQGSRFAVSHDPRELAGSNPGWLELILDGMTFDISGLHPAPPILPADAEFQYDILPDLPLRLGALPIIPGPHLAGMESSLPVVRGLLQVARELCDGPGVLAVSWAPAKSRMGTAYFKTVVDDWIAGGPFPVLGLTSLKPVFDGGLQSEGLAYFTGQELRLEPEMATDRVAATRIATRLISSLVESGPVTATTTLTGPGGQKLLLSPSANRKFVRLSAE